MACADLSRACGLPDKRGIFPVAVVTDRGQNQAGDAVTKSENKGIERPSEEDIAATEIIRRKRIFEQRDRLKKWLKRNKEYQREYQKKYRLTRDPGNLREYGKNIEMKTAKNFVSTTVNMDGSAGRRKEREKMERLCDRRPCAMQVSEDDLEAAITEYLELVLPDDCVAYHIPNAGKRKAKAISEMKRAGLKAGMTDRGIVWHGFAFFLRQSAHTSKACSAGRHMEHRTRLIRIKICDVREQKLPPCILSKKSNPRSSLSEYR